MRKKAILIHADTSAARLPSPRFLTNLEARHFLFAVVKYACYIGGECSSLPADVVVSGDRGSVPDWLQRCGKTNQFCAARHRKFDSYASGIQAALNPR
jgi:hypothetical protein